MLRPPGRLASQDCVVRRSSSGASNGIGRRRGGRGGGGRRQVQCSTYVLESPKRLVVISVISRFSTSMLHNGSNQRPCAYDWASLLRAVDKCSRTMAVLCRVLPPGLLKRRRE